MISAMIEVVSREKETIERNARRLMQIETEGTVAPTCARADAMVVV